MITTITNNDATREAFCFWARDARCICAALFVPHRSTQTGRWRYIGMVCQATVRSTFSELYFASTWLGASYENVCQRYTSIRYAIHSDSFGSLIVDSSLSHAARALHLPLSISCNLQVAGFDPQRRLCDSRTSLGARLKIHDAFCCINSLIASQFIRDHWRPRRCHDF